MFYLDSAHYRIQTLIDHLHLCLAMKLRRREKRSELEGEVLLQDATTAGGRSSVNTLSGAEGFKGHPVKVPLLEGPLFALGLSVSSWPWWQGMTVASGLLVALLLAQAQACWVNSIHENLLWFSELMVRAAWTHFFGTIAQVHLTFSIGQVP